MDKKHDFTQGNIGKQLITFSVPIMLTNLLQLSYQFIDSLWVGNLIGADALGSVAVASTAINVALAFILGISTATLTILSQLRAKRDKEGLVRYLNAFVVLLVGLSLIAGFIGFAFAENILYLLNTPSSMIHEAKIYLQINSVGIIFLIGYNFIVTVMRAIGDSKTPLKIVFATVILNSVLDPIFIGSLGMGVAGAALATILSQGISFFAGLVYVYYNKLLPFSKPFLPGKNEVSVILRLGIPAGLQRSVISAGSAAIMSVINSFGPAVVSGYSAAGRLDSLIMLPASSLGTAVTSMSGQNIGANKWDRVYKTARNGLLFNIIVMLPIALLVYIFAEPAVRLFIQDADSVAFAKQYLQTIAFFYPFLGINFVLNGVVRGSGAMYQVLVLNIISFWLLRYPLTGLISSIMGESGIAIGMGVSFVISSIFASAYYRFGGWRNKELFRSNNE